MEKTIEFSDIKFNIPGAKVVMRKKGISRLVIRSDGDFELKSITFEHQRDGR